MIKTWVSFNENVDNLKELLFNKLSEIREFFYELEDAGIIKYRIIVPGYETYVQVDPSNIENYLDQIVHVIKLNSSLRAKKLPDYKSKHELCIIVDIKLPGENNDFGSTVIGNEGLKLFDDILSASSRLIDGGYEVKLDLNASHHEYKPIKFLIYFNI